MQTKFPQGRVVRERYIVEDLLGQGGFGAVYRVRDRRVRSNVYALKEVADPNSHQRACFVFEGELLRRLDHSALPRVYRIFEDVKHNRAYMLMDYIEGPNLERLRQQQPAQRFTLSRVIQLMTPIVEAVCYLHMQDPPVIHRDIKPSNIIVPSSGEATVLVDFGIAKEYDQDSTTTAVRHCSPGYGAPEQYVRGTNTQTDIYGLGATFYALLTGEVPTDAIYRITRLSGRGADPLELANVLVPAIPQPIADALQQAMAVNLSDRFTTVEEFWETIKVCADAYVEPYALPENGAQAEKPDEVAALLSASLASPDALSPETPRALATFSLLREQTWGQLFMHSSLLRLALVLFVLVGLVTGVTFGAGFWPGSKQFRHGVAPFGKDTLNSATKPITTPSPTRTSFTQSISTPAAIAPTATSASSTPEINPAPGMAPTQKAHPPLTSYPILSTHYDGRIHNTPVVMDSSITLSQVRQSASSISGNFSVGPGLLGNGNFNGTVTADDRIQFIVVGYSGLLPLFFQGLVNADGSISGVYCSFYNGQCDYNGGGYGTWSVTPPALWTQSSLPANLNAQLSVITTKKR